MSDKSRESRVGRELAKTGHRLTKDDFPPQYIGQNADHQGGYLIVDQASMIVAGERFDLDLDDAERWASASAPAVSA